jgi:hypothetical protein
MSSSQPMRKSAQVPQSQSLQLPSWAPQVIASDAAAATQQAAITEVQWGCLPAAGLCFPIVAPGCVQGNPTGPWSTQNLADLAFGVTVPSW